MDVGKRAVCRRLLELGLPFGEVKLIQYFCGYVVEIRGVKYAVDSSAVNIIKEMSSESR